MVSLSLFVVVILFLLLCSAFFSASETALTAINKPQVQRMISSGRKNGKTVQGLVSNMSRVIGTILLGNNLVNILATSLATHLFIKLFDETGIGIATLLMTFLILIFSELMPKLYAIHHPERVSLIFSPLMARCVSFFFPLTQLIRRLSESLWQLFGVQFTQKTASTYEELRRAIEIAEQSDQKEMLHGILDLSVVSVEEVMIHRKDVELIDYAMPLDQIRQKVMKSPYTRLPVWDQDPENIIGILHVKTFLRYMDMEDDFSLRSILQKPIFSPETTPLSKQIEVFRSQHQHLAIVMDEYGDIQGIVTLQDVLEEVVGQMLDEHDVRQESIRGTKDEGYVVEGSMTLRDLKRKVGWKISHREATTLGGFLLYESRALPKVDQVYFFQGFRLEVLRCHRHQVKLVKVQKMPEGTLGA